jgi:hypothetical protein
MTPPKELKLISGSDIDDVAGALFAMTRDFGQQLGNAVNLHFLANKKPDWFRQLQNTRKAKGADKYRDPLDIRFLLWESSEPDSPLIESIPGFSEQWKAEANSLRRKLNKVYHYSLEADLDTLEDIFTIMSVLSHASSLPLLNHLALQLERITKLKNGWKPETVTQAEPQAPEVAEFVNEATKKKQRIFARPPVGSVWNGPIGARTIELNRNLRDALENGVSVAHEMGENGKEKVREWLRYFPQGGEIKVSDDGAVMAYVRGVPILIGWFGEEPDVDPDAIRGYYLPHDYEFTGTDVKDLVTGTLLSESASEGTQDFVKLLENSLTTGAVFNVTTYGDVVYDSEAAEDPVKLTRIHKDLWFVGQLG